MMLSWGIFFNCHYDDVTIRKIASQITSLTIVYSTVYSDADQRKHQSSASLAFVRGIHRRPVNSPHKWPVTRKMFPFDDVIMNSGAIVFPADSLAQLRTRASANTLVTDHVWFTASLKVCGLGTDWPIKCHTIQRSYYSLLTPLGNTLFSVQSCMYTKPTMCSYGYPSTKRGWNIIRQFATFSLPNFSHGFYIAFRKTLRQG